MKQIIPPTNCPSCSSILREVNFQLFCDNDNCNAKSLKFTENFCKVMKYKGLGPETLAKANLTSIVDILNLVEDDSKLREAVGDKTTDKIVEIIEKSRTTATLPQVIQALGIPLIGKVAAEKIAKAAKTIDNLVSIASIADSKNWGLTEKILENFQEWVYNNGELSYYFPKFFKLGEVEETVEGQRGVVCITGKMNSFKVKQEGYNYAISQGFKVVENFNKTVTHLINESGKETSTTLKAKQNNVTILTNIFELEEV